VTSIFGSTAVDWAAFFLLTPFWWAMGLLVLALLGDIWPPMGARVSRLFDELKHM
jgi:hypothetical protein